MAAAPGATHGGKRRNSGRKRKSERSNSAQLVWNRQHKQIYFSNKFIKIIVNINRFLNRGKTRKMRLDTVLALTEFAAHLLSLEYRRRCV